MQGTLSMNARLAGGRACRAALTGVAVFIGFICERFCSARLALSVIWAWTWSTGRRLVVEALVEFLVTTYSIHGMVLRSSFRRSSPDTKMTGTSTRPQE